MILFRGNLIPLWVALTIALSIPIYLSLPPAPQQFEGTETPILLFLLVIAITFLLIFILSRFPQLREILEYFIIAFLGLYITYPTLYGALLPFLLLVNRNLVYSIVSVIASVTLAAVLPFYSVVILYLLLSIYDIIAVFVTKHMLELVRRLGFRRGDTPALGGGDVIIPLLLTLKLLDIDLLYGFVAALSHMFTVGLLLTFVKKYRMALPALPFIFIGQALGVAFLFLGRLLLNTFL